MQNSSSQTANIVPFTQFVTHLPNKALPQNSLIVPNVNDDATTEPWPGGCVAASNIAPLISNSAFQSSGLLIITFDEGDQSDLQHGGGQVATVIVSSAGEAGLPVEDLYQHQSVLRLVLASSGVNSFPGLAGTAPDMTEFFSGPLSCFSALGRT